MNNLKIGCAWLAGLVSVIVLIFVLAVVFGLMRLPLMNINREVTQHSQQYVETKRSLLLSLIADAEGAQTSEQRVAITNRFCEEYSYVDFDVPSSVRGFASANCR